MLLLRKKICPQDFHADIFGQFSGIFFEMTSWTESLRENRCRSCNPIPCNWPAQVRHTMVFLHYPWVWDESPGINPFHSHAHPQSRELPHWVIFPDVGMIQTASGFKLLAEHFIVERIVPVLPADCFQHGNPAPAFAFVQFERTVFIIFAKNTKIFVNLSKEYTSLKSREWEELLRFQVMSWQPS